MHLSLILLHENFHHKRTKSSSDSVTEPPSSSSTEFHDLVEGKKTLTLPPTKQCPMVTNLRSLAPETMSLSMEDQALSPAGSDLKCDGYGIFLVISSLLFVLYLTVHAKKNLNGVCRRGSYVVVSYFALLWLVTLLNLAWSFLQVHHFTHHIFPFYVYCFLTFLLCFNIDFRKWRENSGEVGYSLIYFLAIASEDATKLCQ